MVIVLSTGAASNMTATTLRALALRPFAASHIAAAEPRGKLRNPGRGTRVNAQRIGDFDLNFLHRV